MFADKINLTMSETLLVAVAGIAVVLLELAIIAILIVFLSKIIRSIEGKLGSSDKGSDAPAAAPAPVPAVPVAATPAPAVAYAQGRTQLIDVDEPTAAVVMALTSKESGIPLERLSFKSIRGITELVDVDERTAATIMAIVSQESGIPLNRLSFKSIRKLED